MRLIISIKQQADNNRVEVMATIRAGTAKRTHNNGKVDKADTIHHGKITIRHEKVTAGHGKAVIRIMAVRIITAIEVMTTMTIQGIAELKIIRIMTATIEMSIDVLGKVMGTGTGVIIGAHPEIGGVVTSGSSVRFFSSVYKIVSTYSFVLCRKVYHCFYRQLR